MSVPTARNEDIRKGEAILTVRALTSEPRFRNVDLEVRSFEVLGTDVPPDQIPFFCSL